MKTTSSNLTDSHIHTHQSESLAQVLVQEDVFALVNSQSPEEWDFNRQLAEASDQIRLSFGIHPWEADRYKTEDLMTFYQEAHVLGEIGLDQPWTDLPLAVQYETFVLQLEIAQSFKKPVILHTKGYEKEVLQTIKKYPNTYYIHWYSSDDYVTEYLDLGCYMSVGPDYEKNPRVRRLAQIVPKDRLLIETDGLDALAWAKGLKEDTYASPSYLTLLQDLYEGIASLIHCPLEELKSTVRGNLAQFLES